MPTIDQRGAVRGPARLERRVESPTSAAYEASSSYVVSTNADTLAVGTLRTGVGWADVSTNANPAKIAQPRPQHRVFQHDRNDHLDRRHARPGQ